MTGRNVRVTGERDLASRTRNNRGSRIRSRPPTGAFGETLHALSIKPMSSDEKMTILTYQLVVATSVARPAHTLLLAHGWATHHTDNALHPWRATHYPDEYLSGFAVSFIEPLFPKPPVNRYT